MKKHCYLTLYGQDDMDLMFSPHVVITLALSVDFSLEGSVAPSGLHGKDLRAVGTDKFRTL